MASTDTRGGRRLTSPAPQSSPSAERAKITFSPPAAGPYSPRTLYVFSTSLFLVSIGSGLLGVSYLYCPSHLIPALKPLCDDNYYKYLVPLLIPLTAWFGIANWVGWEYFKYS